MTNRIITPEKMFSDTGQMLEDAFALRLAELLDCSVVVSDQQAATELRRLHAELVECEKWRDRDEFRAANAERERDIAEAQRDALLEACKTLVNLPGTEDWAATLRLAVEQARAAIAKAEGEKT